MDHLVSQVKEFLKENASWRKDSDLLMIPPTAEEVMAEFPEMAWETDLTGLECCRIPHYPVEYQFDVTPLALYVKMRHSGQSHAMPAMCATQKAPKAMSDRELFSGIGRLDQQYEPRYIEEIVYNARVHGYNPNPNDMYMQNLARFPGDPEAFVPPTGGRGHIKKVCEDRGLPCEGAVNVKGGEPRPPEPVRLAADLAEDIVKKRIQRNPDLAKVPRKDLTQQVIEDHGAKK